jgi:hypothetical protein
MKQKAQSIFIKPFDISYANIFDESDKEYKRYKLFTQYIDDGIQVTMTTETSKFSDVQTAFNEYVNAMNTASSSILTIDSLEIENNGRLSFQSGKYSKGIIAMGAGSEECKATPVSPGSLTAHDYVSSSRNRGILFNKVKTSLNSKAGGAIATASLKYGTLISKLKDRGNHLVSVAGSVLGVLDITQIKLNTADGGFLKGYMNFKSESFDIAVATDGDCNDIPINANNLESSYTTTTNSGADKMIELLLGYGGRLSLPVCQKETKVCTSVNGQTLGCSLVCFQWR